MLQLLLDLARVDAESGVDSESQDQPLLVAAAFIPQHLPDRVFFLTSNLPGVRRLPQFTNFYMYDSDLTIVPDQEWASGTGWMPWASLPITLLSLVRIRPSGTYSGSLGIVMATSPEFGDESLVVAVVPKIPYPPTSTASLETDMDTPSPQSGPSRKRQKLGHQEERAASLAIEHGNAEAPRRSVSKATASKPQARLFDLDHHLKYMGRKPPVITHGDRREDGPSRDCVSDMSLADFFATPQGSQSRFPSKEISIPNEYGQPVKTTCDLDCRKLLWAGKPTLPLYEFAGSFYWKGMLLMPIYRYASVDREVVSYSKQELVPFIEANISPSVFGPLLSQLHWKRGDNIIEASYYDSASQIYEAIVFKIDEVTIQQGIASATPFQLLRRDGLHQTRTWLADIDIDAEPQQVLSRCLQSKISDGRQECPLATYRLYLSSGDYVRVVTGKDQGVCGHVIVSEASQVSVLPKGSTNPVSLPLLLDYDFFSSCCCKGCGSPRFGGDMGAHFLSKKSIPSIRTWPSNRYRPGS